MLYALKIATRYLTANKAQTALLITGVAVGVFIFIFMSALIGGLAEFILSRTVGDLVPHHHRSRKRRSRAADCSPKVTRWWLPRRAGCARRHWPTPPLGCP